MLLRVIWPFLKIPKLGVENPQQLILSPRHISDRLHNSRVLAQGVEGEPESAVCFAVVLAECWNVGME